MRFSLYLYVNTMHRNCAPGKHKMVKAVSVCLCLSVCKKKTVLVTTVINNDDDSITTVCNFVDWVYCRKLTISLL